MLMMVAITVGVVVYIWHLCKVPISTLIGRVTLGLIIMMIVNYMMPAYELGINLITLGCAGVLGIPGVITLYIVNMVI